jgi:MscS family membrane protein
MNLFPFLHWLDYEIGQNSIGNYLTVFLVILALLVLRRFISHLVSRILYKIIRNKPHFSALRTFENLLSKPLEWLITLAVLYFSISQLKVPLSWNLGPSDQPGILMGLTMIFKVTLIGAFTFLILRFIDFLALEFLNKEETGKERILDKQLLPFVKELLKIFIVIVAFFFSLGFVFELNIGNIIAGLGLGGLAFALAAKIRKLSAPYG